MTIKAQEMNCLEELAMNAHPALKTQLYDGWVLRFSNGYTNRANSINPLYPHAEGLADKINFCESLYTAQSLPTVYKLTELCSGGLDRMLEHNGYEMVTPTTVMVKPLNHNNFLVREDVTLSEHIDEDWRKSKFALSGILDCAMQETACATMDNIQNRVICAKIEKDGKIVACGLGVLERGYVGLFDIAVDEASRRQGLAFALCGTLLNEAKRLGAVTAYLQVVAANLAANALYQKLGFKGAYQYWYRVKAYVPRSFS